MSEERERFRISRQVHENFNSDPGIFSRGFARMARENRLEENGGKEQRTKTRELRKGNRERKKGLRNLKRIRV